MSNLVQLIENERKTRKISVTTMANLAGIDRRQYNKFVKTGHVSFNQSVAILDYFGYKVAITKLLQIM